VIALQQDKPGVVAPPPLIYMAALLLEALLQLALPIRFLPDWWPLILGLPLIGAAILLAGWALRVMRHTGTNVNPYKSATVLVIGGPFRFTRNPIYLAFTLLYGGIAALVNTLWVFLLLPIVLVIMRHGVIDREERYLEQKFGQAYVRYKERVRRWI
jgi:protein-S-isoprenylcysteine O-methyltransferase Ste14